MKKITYLKSLLLAAGLCVGASAWADAGDVTTVIDIDFSEGITDAVSAAAGKESTGTVNGTEGAMTLSYDSRYPFAVDTDGHLQVGGAVNSSQSGATVLIPEENRAGYGRAVNKDIVTVSFDIWYGNLSNKATTFKVVTADNTTVASLTYGRYGNGILSDNTFELTAAQFSSASGNDLNWSQATHFVLSK